ncbi:unnamed protein product [Calicophoron daubneyi]|uniref:Rubicon Homology domain-containing protein n=1 Tax=Calicophoron daubneyi TaxID=300641 RepID=A0AAV2T2B0_CALDB
MTSEKDSAKSQSEVKDVPTSALTAINQTMSRLSNPSQSSHPESGRIRICHLTGKYYCGRCHWDDQWYIPGSIFLLNDASLQPLSRQAYLKLRVLWDSAIYRVPDYWHTENPEAAKVFKLRTEFHRMLNYCLMCSGAAAVKAASELVVPVHLLGYPHYMRMYDVIETLEGRLLPKLESELKLWTEHMSSCEACSRRSSYLDDALSIDTKEEENDIAQISWTNSGLENENYP